MRLKDYLFCLILCLVTTLYLIMEIYIVKNHVTISDIIIRYISSIAIGLAFEKYLYILGYFANKLKCTVKQKKPIGIIQYLYFLFIFGILGSVLGMGTFMVLAIKFMMGFSIAVREVVIVYIIFLIGGFCFGSIVYIINCVMKKVKS